MEEHAHPAGSNDFASSVLVVDDENGIRDLISRWLQAGGYSVTSASGAVEALDLMQTLTPAVAVCDIRMPGRDGIWLADRILQQFPETAVIMATAVQDAVDTAAGLGDGVVDYLTKPFERNRLSEAVIRGMHWHRSARASRCWRERLEADVERRRSKLADAIGALNLEPDCAIDALLSMLSQGADEAGAHARRVAELARETAAAMGLAPEEIVVIRRAALMHDLGKLALPEALLQKPAPLTADEQAIVRRYPQLGSDLMAGLPFMEEPAAIVRATRERLDGEGYPKRLSAPQVSLGARIVAVADAYDTMIRARVFRDAISPAAAVQELERCSGTQFDAGVVGVVKQLVAPAH